MTARRSPSLPTPKQIEATHDVVSKLHPGARIVRVGPEGVTFDYPDAKPDLDVETWKGRPFSDRT